MCAGRKRHFARDRWSQANQDRTVNEVEGTKVDSDAAKEFVFTFENIVKDVSFSQGGCEVHEDGMVMTDSGASVNVCPKWFVETVLEKSDGSVELRGADGRTLQDYGIRHIRLRIGSRLRQCDFHVVEVTKQILSVSYLCEHGIETRLSKQPFLKYGERHESLIKKSGCVLRQGADRSRSQGHSRVTRTSWRFTETHAYELKIRKTHLMQIHRTRKIHAIRPA